VEDRKRGPSIGIWVSTRGHMLSDISSRAQVHNRENNKQHKTRKKLPMEKMKYKTGKQAAIPFRKGLHVSDGLERSADQSVYLRKEKNHTISADFWPNSTRSGMDRTTLWEEGTETGRAQNTTTRSKINKANKTPTLK
jgi:hypothetical protein